METTELIEALSRGEDSRHQFKESFTNADALAAEIVALKWFTEFGHLNRGDMLTSEQHRCHNEKKKFQRRV